MDLRSYLAGKVQTSRKNRLKRRRMSYEASVCQKRLACLDSVSVDLEPAVWMWSVPGLRGTL